MQGKTLALALTGVLGLAAAGSAPAQTADNGNLVNLTVHVRQTMSGVAAIPPRTVQRKICMQPGGFSPAALQNAKQRASKMCRITHYAKQGDTVTFDQMCKVRGEDIVSHGVFHLGTGFNFTGTTHTAMSAMGHAITVDADYTGKRVGSCAYTPPAAASK